MTRPARSAESQAWRDGRAARLRRLLRSHRANPDAVQVAEKLASESHGRTGRPIHGSIYLRRNRAVMAQAGVVPGPWNAFTGWTMPSLHPPTSRTS